MNQPINPKDTIARALAGAVILSSYLSADGPARGPMFISYLQPPLATDAVAAGDFFGVVEEALK